MPKGPHEARADRGHTRLVHVGRALDHQQGPVGSEALGVRTETLKGLGAISPLAQVSLLQSPELGAGGQHLELGKDGFCADRGWGVERGLLCGCVDG